MVLFILIGFSQPVFAFGDIKISDEAKLYCQDFKTNIKKRYLIRAQIDKKDLFENDLPHYTQYQCEVIVQKMILGDITELSLNQNSNADIFYGNDLNDPSDDTPKEQRTFDLSLACLASKPETLRLSAIDDWDVLNCIQNKHLVEYVTLDDFNYRPLDLRLLEQFSNIKLLRLKSGRLLNFDSILSLLKLSSFSLYNVKLTKEQQQVIGKLESLTSLSLNGNETVYTSEMDSSLIYIDNISDLNKLKILTISYFNDVNIDGVERLTGLNRLNLIDVNLQNKYLYKISSVNSLEHLSISGNKGVSSIKPLVYLKNLESLDISETSVSDLSPLAKHKVMNAEKRFASLKFYDSNVVDMTLYYEKGGTVSTLYSGSLLSCSPQSKKEYDAGKRCNEQQRQCPLARGYGLGYVWVDKVTSPLCLWWHSD